MAPFHLQGRKRDEISCLLLLQFGFHIVRPEDAQFPSFWLLLNILPRRLQVHSFLVKNEFLNCQALLRFATWSKRTRCYYWRHAYPRVSRNLIGGRAVMSYNSMLWLATSRRRVLGHWIPLFEKRKRTGWRQMAKSITSFRFTFHAQE